MALTKVTRNLLSTGIDDQSTSTAITIDSSGNVGIGATSPQDRLHVALDSATTNAEVEVMRVEATSSGTPVDGFGPFIDFRGDRQTGSPDSYGRIGFESDGMTPTTVDGAFIIQTAEDGTYTERMRVSSGGSVGIGTNNPTDKLHVVGTSFLNGNTYVGSGGAGSIYLSAGAGIFMNGGTTSAKHLDDYEEGTWTPAIRGSGVAGSYTYSLGYGVYTKIGRQVTISFYLQDITEVSAGTGYLQITGCPFTKAASQFFSGTVNVQSVDWFNSNTYATLQFTSVAGSSVLYVRLNGDNYAGSDLQLSELVSGSSDIGGTITFFNA